jgi:F0F1-type ATP synthase assembly protein I
MTEPQPPEPPNRWANPPQLGDYFFMGTACAIAVVGGGGGGYALDAWLHTTPWLTFVGLLFGLISAVMIGVKQYRKLS